MATFIQIRRMLQLAAPVIAFFLFVSDSAEGAGTAMDSALQTSNFDSVGRDRIWIGQQSLDLPVSKVPCRREPRIMAGFLYRCHCAMPSYLLFSFSCDSTPLFLTKCDAAHLISSRTVSLSNQHKDHGSVHYCLRRIDDSCLGILPSRRTFYPSVKRSSSFQWIWSTSKLLLHFDP